jgi:pseudaminic acid biosynthesis-associated methylase
MNSQEKLWQSKLGDNYISRNNSNQLLKNKIFHFKKIMQTHKINSIVELGSNIGLNLIALNRIYKNLLITAVEINKKACFYLSKIKNVKIINDSILKFEETRKFDLVLMSGILIHIAPKNLPKLYEKIYKLSKKYILICEYYNPHPVNILYRGKKNQMFKRDFAGEFLKIYKNYKLIDCRFAYHLDKYPLDDISFFLLKKFK